MTHPEDDSLLDYDENFDTQVSEIQPSLKSQDEKKKGNYVAIHATGFRDFLLRPELLRAITDCGFEHPSEVQHETIPQAILGTDILCQAKSGMGKTAVFVLSTLQEMNLTDDSEESYTRVLVLCHARELAFQISHEFQRFSKYLPKITTAVFYGGVAIREDFEKLEKSKPVVVIGTPGRILSLTKSKHLDFGKLKHFILDECDRCLEKLDMRKDIQQIFMMTPRDKQVMMFSATMPQEMRSTCKKFMNDPHEISVDDDTKLTLHGLLQYYVHLEEKEKNRKLADVLDNLEFNQVVIFVNTVKRCNILNELLCQCKFPSIAIHSGLEQSERIEKYQQFKCFQKRILVTTDLLSRGIDVERVNIVINYDFPTSSDQYLHRVGRAGRFGTKGLAISFVSSDESKELLSDTQSRFEVKIPQLPERIEATAYINA